jgi:outer membrane protein TolC
MAVVLGTTVRKLALAASLSALLDGCAFYNEMPLPSAPNLVQPEAKQALDLSTTVERALAYSPDLELQRRSADVALAAAYAGGLLPDPQVSASADQPTVEGSGLVNGYALGLGEDLQALLTEPSRAEGAEAKQAQAKLELLWVEWQTVQQTANLYVQKFYDDQKNSTLADTAKILNAQAEHSQNALAARNTTIDVAGSDLSAALDIESQRASAARSALADDADLKALLAFAPITEVALSNPGDPMPITKQMVEDALNLVTKRRPDLLALAAGYHAQDEAVMTAILQQFPAISLEFSHAADTSNLQTNGLSVSLNIPIFGSTQAKIRTERATRAQLYAEYQTRLDQTEADVWRLWRILDVLRSQVDGLEESVPRLKEMAEAGQKAYAAGNLPPATYVLLQTTLSARQSELFDLRSLLWSDTIALRTLLALAPIVPGVSYPKDIED